MDFIMYTCPECRKVFKVKGNGKKVKCSKCSDSYLKDLRITPEEWGELDANAKKRCIENAITEPAISGSSTVETSPRSSDNITPVKSSHVNIPGAVFKCKMCGGRLEVQENDSVCTCEYCGTRQTLPKLDDERKINLYDRANHFRRNNDYDKAMGIYEQILNEDSSDAESYWSLVLCRYGIEYVEDPATHNRIPTINRTQYTSIYEDEDYKSAIKYADALQKSVYEQEANTINEIQKGILAISNKEEPFDVFICYKETDDSGRRTPDSVLANDLYHQLTQEGFKVFFSRITLEDKLGQEYEPYIFAALNSAKVMVVLGTKPEYFNAIWVKNEWSRYLALIKKDNKKTLVPAYKDMDPYDLPEEFSHLQAQDMEKLGFMQDLIRGIKKITGEEQERVSSQQSVIVQQGVGNADALLQRGFMALEDKEWRTANDFFENVLNIDASCAIAYLGKAMAENSIDQKDKIGDFAISIINNKNYQRAMRFGDEPFKSEIYGIIYSKACSLRDEGSLNKAIELFGLINDYRDTNRVLNDCVTKLNNFVLDIKAKRLASSTYKKNITCNQYYAIGLNADGLLYSFGDNYKGRLNVKEWRNVVEITSMESHTVGLRSDGTALAVGDNDNGECNVEDWRNLVSVSAGNCHTLGLLEDGTVLATGDNKKGQCDVDKWGNIKAVSAGFSRSVGIRKDGTVVAVGSNAGNVGSGACDVNKWKDIVEVSTGGNHTLGLCSDGTVVATGSNENRECEVSNWRNIVSISAGFDHSIGLCIDGTVVATGNNEKGQCEIKDWKDIVTVKAGVYRTIGIKADGTVVLTATGEKYGNEIIGMKLLWSNEDVYKTACDYMNNEKYTKAVQKFRKIKDYRDSAELLENCIEKINFIIQSESNKRMESRKRKKQIMCTSYYAIGIREDGYIYVNNSINHHNISNWRDIAEISVHQTQILGLKEDGKVVAIIGDDYGQSNAKAWDGIISIAAGFDHSLGLLKNGNVVCAGNNKYGQCDVGGWTDIVAISAGCSRSLGLRKDGTVVATGNNKNGACNVYDWTDIIEVSTGEYHSLGLCSDGTVVAVGLNEHGECEVNDWKHIISVSAGYDHSVGLCLDGTVIASGCNERGQCDVENWKNILAINAADGCTIGLRADGTVVATGNKNDVLEEIKQWKLLLNNEDIYRIACNFMEQEKYEEAFNEFKKIVSFNDSEKLLEICIEKVVDLNRKSMNYKKQIVGNKGYVLGLRTDGTVFASGLISITDKAKLNGAVEISALQKFGLGLKKDGTVIAIGAFEKYLDKISNWKNIIAVAAGNDHSLGLMDNGMAVACGSNNMGECQVQSWKDIVSISAGWNLSLGLCKDGTVVATGNNGAGACDVNGWSGVIEVSAGGNHSLGLCSDGRVIATGSNKYRECEVGNWRNIVSVSAGFDYSVGLCSDGTVVATGNNNDKQCDVEEWRDIIAVKAGNCRTIGLKSDGTVVVTEPTNKISKVDVEYWNLLVVPTEDDLRSIYNTACEYMDTKDYRRAIAEFKRIPGYRNSDTLQISCRKMSLKTTK